MRKLRFVDWVFALLAVAIVAGGGIMLFHPSAASSHSVHQQAAQDIVPASHSDGLSEVEGGYRFERVIMPERPRDRGPGRVSHPRR